MDNIEITRPFAVFVEPDGSHWTAHVTGYQLDNVTFGDSPADALLMSADMLEGLTGQSVTGMSMVREFHERFGQPVADEPNVADDKLNELRINLLDEELDELSTALAAHDPVAVLDALTDLQYVLDGAYLSLGFHRYKDAALREVHRSNMTKLGDDGKPVVRADGKVTKGPRYEPPDLARVMRDEC